MAKIDWNRLTKKYGTENVRAGRYRALMRDIIAHNTQQIGTAVARLSNTHFNNAMRKVTTKEKRFIVPDISNVVPSGTVYIRKGAEKGKLLTTTIRNSLTRDLRGVMDIVTEKTGEPRYIRRRGEKAGTINTKIIDEYEKRIRNTFSGYVERGKLQKVPGNIHTIAVTEVRSAVNDIKYRYAMSLYERNEGQVEARKFWVHNRSLSDTPRIGHMEVSELTGRDPIPVTHFFVVPWYHDKGKKAGQLRGIHRMKAPHDPSAIPEQVIGCNCDVQFIFVKKA